MLSDRHPIVPPLLSRTRSYALVAALALCTTGCGAADEETPPGCASNNRSQCVMQVALGDHFGCARLHDRTVWCWGENDESQLGYSTTDVCLTALPDGKTQSVACHSYPFQVAGIAKADTLSAGDKFACTLRTDGTVACWGSNTVGQLGRGDVTSSKAPVEVKGIAGATSISLGARHACAVVGGAVWCWGANDAMQLGAAHASQACGAVGCETSPRAIDGLKDIKRVACGIAHTCAIGNDGSVSCWGANNYGQLGIGVASDNPSSVPRPVIAGHLVRFAADIVAGGDHTCTVRDDGAVVCWGRNDHGELGSLPDGVTPDHCAAACSPIPLLVSKLPDAPTFWDTSITVDGGAPPDLATPDLALPAPDLAMAADDLAMTPSDDGAAPEIHDLAVADLVAAPVQPPLTPPRSLAAGAGHTCALLEGGTLRCWGGNSEDQLGDGRRGDEPQAPVVPIAQPGAAIDNPLANVTRIAAGAATTCARISDGTLRCFGSNILGALGEGSVTPEDGPVPLVW